jgi:hypothetical protein
MIISTTLIEASFAEKNIKIFKTLSGWMNKVNKVGNYGCYWGY